MKETIKNDAYLWRCECPNCGKILCRGEEERKFYCEKCGTHLHQRAFTEAELEKASKIMMPVIPTKDAVEIVRNGGAL